MGLVLPPGTGDTCVTRSHRGQPINRKMESAYGSLQLPALRFPGLSYLGDTLKRWEEVVNGAFAVQPPPSGAQGALPLPVGLRGHCEGCYLLITPW